jgi:Rhomboid family
MLRTLYIPSTSLLLVLAVQAAVELLGKGSLTERRVPWIPIGLCAVAIAGVVVQLSWPHAYDVLADDPSRSGWWRPFTTTFLQSGLPGSAYNLITLAIVAALAEWFWGRRTALALFIVGIVGPRLISSVLIHGSQAHGLGDNPRNFVGSSGATYLLAATLAGALVVSRLRGPRRAWTDAAPALGLLATGVLSWIFLANAHGLVSVYGLVIGAVVALVLRTTGAEDAPLRRPDEQPVVQLLPRSVWASLLSTPSRPRSLVPSRIHEDSSEVPHAHAIHRP